MASATRPVVRIAPNNPVFDLPVIVGIEEGLFENAGLDVSFSATYADRERDSAEKPVLSRLKEQMFECGSADSYNVCEWASIDRLERGGRGAGHPDFRRKAADAARPRRRSRGGAGAHRLALHDAANAGERRGARARQDPERQPAVQAMGRSQRPHLPCGGRDGAFYQPGIEGGGAYHRRLVLSRRRGGGGRPDN